MTREETKIMLATIAAVYPPNLMPQMTEDSLSIWYRLLQDLNFKDVSTVITAWMVSNKYPPTIHDIREKITHARMPEIDTSDAAWGKLMRAVRVHGWNQRNRAIKEMGERIWNIAKNFGWEYYCNMLIEDESIYFAQFRNAYEVQVKREKEHAQLPPAFAAALAKIGNGSPTIKGKYTDE